MKKLEKKVERKIEKTVLKPKNFIKMRDVKEFANDALKFGGRAVSSAISHPLGRLAIQYATGLNLNGESSTQIPVTTSTVRSNYRSLSAAPKFKGFSGGLRIVASQHLTVVGAANTFARALADGGSNGIPLSPDFIGGAMATDARNYNRFVFREVTFEYIPNVGSGGPLTATACQSVCFAYTADADADAFAGISFFSLQNVKDSVTGQTWARFALPVKPLGDILYYTEEDSTSSASIRQTCQGLFCGMFSIVANATQASIGNVVMHYVLDLYDRSMDYGFTISVNLPKKDLLLQAYRVFGNALSRRDQLALQNLLRKETEEKVDLNLEDSLKHLLIDFGNENHFSDCHSISSSSSLSSASLKAKSSSSRT